MKILGFLLIIISGIIIFVNTVIIATYNEKIANEQPLTTIFSGGKNLKKRYTFTPPYTGFEVFVFIMGITGIILVVPFSGVIKDNIN